MRIPHDGVRRRIVATQLLDDLARFTVPHMHDAVLAPAPPRHRERGHVQRSAAGPTPRRPPPPRKGHRPRSPRPPVTCDQS